MSRGSDAFCRHQIDSHSQAAFDGLVLCGPLASQSVAHAQFPPMVVKVHVSYQHSQQPDAGQNSKKRENKER
jgi:hypothetical protein